MTIHSEKNHSTIPRRGRQYDNGHRNRRHGIKGGYHQFNIREKNKNSKETVQIWRDKLYTSATINKPKNMC